jgi:hypothetical protein
MKKVDLMYKNSGKAAAHRTQQIALDAARSNASRDGGTPPLMSTEGARLAKLSAPCSPYEVPYLEDGRERFAVSDEERETWRRFKTGDDPSSLQPDPLSALIAEQNDESEEEFDEEPDEESEVEENRELAQTGGAFDRARLFRAIDRLAKRSKRRVASRDGRSYGHDNRGDRSYAVSTGFIGGLEAWNAAFARGEVC